MSGGAISPDSMARKKSPPLQYLFLVTFLLIGLVIAVISFRSARFDLRQHASVDASKPSLSVTTSPATPRVGEPLTINFHLNTKSYDISGIQLPNLQVLLGNVQLNGVPTKSEPVITNLSLLHSLLTQTTSGYRLDHIRILSTPTTPYNSSNQTVTIASLTFTPTSAGTIQIIFDGAATKVTEFGGTAGNILNPPVNQSFTVAAPTATATSTPFPTSVAKDASPVKQLLIILIPGFVIVFIVMTIFITRKRTHV